MTEIEKVIKHLNNKNCIGNDYSNGEDMTLICLTDKQAQVVIEALQEKQEREQGCKNCTAGDGEFLIKCSKWNDDDFCGQCGRKLGEANG